MQDIPENSTPLAVRGFNSSGFCESLADVLASEAFNQYGKIDVAVIAYRIKCEELKSLFVGNHGRKNWKTAQRDTAARMYKVISRMGVQEKLV